MTRLIGVQEPALSHAQHRARHVRERVSVWEQVSGFTDGRLKIRHISSPKDLPGVDRS